MLSWLTLLFLGVVCGGDPVVTTEYGQVRGQTQPYRGASVLSFIGLPYAQPPLGPLRWKAPIAHPPWQGVKNLTEFSPICPQPPSDGYTFPPNYTIDEDCLTLNIWAPVNISQPKSVVFWIHGGGFKGGGNVELRERGGEMAAVGNVVVVVINYRLAMLGFLAHPALLAEGNAVGNWGLKDQAFALAWVYRNIASFGGLPENITIMGQSAGGSSVSFHLVLPSSRPFFSQAVIESGVAFFELLGLNQSLTIGEFASQEVGCHNKSEVLECLRAKPWKELISTPILLATIDGQFFPSHPLTALSQGEFAKVPVMFGDVSGELWSTVASIFPHKPLSPLEYEAFVEVLVGKTLAKEVLALYPCSTYNASDCRPTVGEIMSDFALNCATTLTGQFYANASLPTFGYEFTRRPSWVATPQPWLTGAPHASEIEFVFSTTEFHNSTIAEQNLALSMTQFWTNFAKTGNPNHASAVWPPYSSPSFSRLKIDFNLTVEQWGEKQCQFWQPVYKWYANHNLPLPIPANSPLMKLFQ